MLFIKTIKILLLGEIDAGKDTVLDLLYGKEIDPDKEKENTIYPEKNKIEILHNGKRKHIKIINTPGLEKGYTMIEPYRYKRYDIQLYVFDSRKFYNDDGRIIPFIESIINGMKKYLEKSKTKIKIIGTFGSEVTDETKVKIEKNIKELSRHYGIPLSIKIFEMKYNPRNEVINFLFD